MTAGSTPRRRQRQGLRALQPQLPQVGCTPQTDTLVVPLLLSWCALQLCAGAIRSKNTMNILLQTILDAAVSAICFYLVGCVVCRGQATSQLLSFSTPHRDQHAPLIVCSLPTRRHHVCTTPSSLAPRRHRIDHPCDLTGVRPLSRPTLCPYTACLWPPCLCVCVCVVCYIGTASPMEMPTTARPSWAWAAATR